MGQQAIEKQLDESYFKYPQLIETLSKKPTLNFDQIKDQCTVIGEGCSGRIYLYKKLNIVLKITKNKPNPKQIIKEIMILNRVNSIWPNLFQYLVLNKQNTLIGFSMIFFEGKRIWQAYRDPQNIYFSNPQSRVRLVKKVKQVTKKLQQIGIGHGDLHIDNIMIKQLDKTKEECEILIIDYGLAFQIDNYAPQRPSLTGWAFMKPSQSKTGYFYDAAGLNAYMFGRVALQILLLQSYDDYSHFREQSPQRQLDLITSLGFDSSVRQQIELYLDRDIKVRNKMLMDESIMKENVLKTSGHHEFQPEIQKYGWSLLNLIKKNQFDENYYVRHPQKLGYKDNKLC